MGNAGEAYPGFHSCRVSSRCAGQLTQRTAYCGSDGGFMCAGFASSDGSDAPGGRKRRRKLYHEICRITDRLAADARRFLMREPCAFALAITAPSLSCVAWVWRPPRAHPSTSIRTRRMLTRWWKGSKTRARCSANSSAGQRVTHLQPQDNGERDQAVSPDARPARQQTCCQRGGILSRGR